MPYRDFYWEKQSSVPRAGTGNSISRIADSVKEGASAIFKAIQDQKIRKQQAADNYKFTLEKGTDVNDDIMVDALAKDAIDLTRKGIISDDPVIKNKAKQAQAVAQQSQDQRKKQDQQFRLNDEAAKAKAAADKDYDYDVDKKINGEAFFGPAMNGERNFTNRQEHLDKASEIVGKNPDALNEKGRAKRFVGELAADEMKTENLKGDTFRKRGVFFNGAKPEITDDHVMTFFNYGNDGLTLKKISKQVDQELLREAQNFKQRNPQETKGMSDQEVFDYLKDNPVDNPLNKNGYNTRVVEKGRQLLKDAEATLSEYNRKEVDPTEASKVFKNDKIVHSGAFFNDKSMATTGGGTIKAEANSGPGGVLIQNNGTPLKFTSSNPIRTNVNTGITNKSKVGSTPFNLNGYQLQAFKQSGAPVLLQGDTADELIQSINKLPLEEWGPNSRLKLKPKMSIGLNGFTVNQAHILNAANNQEHSIQSQIAEAKKNGDKETEARLQSRLEGLKELRGLVGSGVDDNELALAASKAGITNIQVNELLEATDSDLASINAMTQGLDLRQKKYWSDDMVRVADAYENRARQATAAGFRTEKTKEEQKAKPKAKNKSVKYNGEDYEVPEGRIAVVKPDGTATTIPMAQKQKAISLGYKILE